MEAAEAYAARLQDPRTSADDPAEFFVTIEAGKRTELDVVALLDPLRAQIRTPLGASASSKSLRFFGDESSNGELVRALFDIFGSGDEGGETTSSDAFCIPFPILSAKKLSLLSWK